MKISRCQCGREMLGWLLLLVCVVARVGVESTTLRGGLTEDAVPASPSPLALAAPDFTAINAAAAGARRAPDCTPHGVGIRYDIGSAAHPSFNEVPWDRLRPDDVVCVPYRVQPYRSKISFITRGAAGHPIRLVGLRGPNGERPVIDGDQATTPPAIAPAAADAFLQDFGLISLHHHFLKPAGAPRGWHPGYITITGLKVRHASNRYAYFDASGSKRSYADFAAGIYMSPGDDVVIEDCEITGNALGIVANSHEGVFGPAELTTQNLTIRGNYIHGNGDMGIPGNHNVHIEGHGCNVIGNYFGHAPGSGSANYKSRCSHERFYANYVHGGDQALLMLVAPRTDVDRLRASPDFGPTVVAGNILEDPHDATRISQAMIHFGGDAYAPPGRYRSTLLMAHNSIVASSHDGRMSVLSAFDPAGSALPMQLWLTNNMVMNVAGKRSEGTLELGLAAGEGHVLLTTNWLSSGVAEASRRNVLTGQMTGWSGSLRGTDPQLAGASLADFRPAPGSPLIDAAAGLAALPAHGMAAATSDYALYEFIGTPSAPWYRKRAIRGSSADIGAYEAL